eukprot:2810022-Amphidinium_carterae.2
MMTTLLGQITLRWYAGSLRFCFTWHSEVFLRLSDCIVNQNSMHLDIYTSDEWHRSGQCTNCYYCESCLKTLDFTPDFEQVADTSAMPTNTTIVCFTSRECFSCFFLHDSTNRRRVVHSMFTYRVLVGARVVLAVLGRSCVAVCKPNACCHSARCVVEGVHTFDMERDLVTQ